MYSRSAYISGQEVPTVVTTPDGYVVIGTPGTWTDDDPPRALTMDVEVRCDGNLFAHGFVKFDGCSNIMFADCERGMALHFCDMKDVDAVREMMAAVYQMASDMGVTP